MSTIVTLQPWRFPTPPYDDPLTVEDLRRVLDEASTSVSGGVPWTALGGAVARLRRALDAIGTT